MSEKIMRGLGSQAMRSTAKKRTANEIGNKSYRVTGGDNEHQVKIESNKFVCDCSAYRQQSICSHIICVMLKRGMPIYFEEMAK